MEGYLRRNVLLLSGPKIGADDDPDQPDNDLLYSFLALYSCFTTYLFIRNRQARTFEYGVVFEFPLFRTHICLNKKKEKNSLNQSASNQVKVDLNF